MARVYGVGMPAREMSVGRKRYRGTSPMVEAAGGSSCSVRASRSCWGVVVVRARHGGGVGRVDVGRAQVRVTSVADREGVV